MALGRLHGKQRAVSDIAMAEPDSVRALLDRPLPGWSDPERRVFAAMSERARLTAAEVAEISAVPDTVDALRRLVARGLVGYDERERRYFPAVPFGLLRELLDQADDQLARTRSALAELAEVIPPSDVEVPTANQVFVVSPTDAWERVGWCVEQAVREFAFVNNGGPTSARSREHEVESRLIARGVRVRGLYEQAAVDAPGGLDDLLWSLANGEEARATLVTPTKWLMVDQEVVLTPVRSGGTYAEGILEVRHPTLVALFAAYYESLWATAVPLADFRRDRTAETFDADDRALASLLATGMNDKAIARQLGVSERTAHRRVVGLMSRLGAESRFQAGVQAARNGLMG